MFKQTVMGMHFLLLSTALWSQQGGNASERQRKVSLREAVSNPSPSLNPNPGPNSRPNNVEDRAARQLSQKERANLRQQLRQQPAESTRSTS